MAFDSFINENSKKHAIIKNFDNEERRESHLHFASLNEEKSSCRLEAEYIPDVTSKIVNRNSVD